MHAGFLLDHCPDPTCPTRARPAGVDGTRHAAHRHELLVRAARGGVETFHPFDYLGFRYLQIDDPGRALAPQRHRRPHPPRRGTRRARWYVPVVGPDHRRRLRSRPPLGAVTPRRSSSSTLPPARRAPWLWDGFNDSQTAMAAFGEQNLTRKSLLEFAQSQGSLLAQGRINKIYPTSLGALDINEFTEIYPEWVWQYWMHTGDRTAARRRVPGAARTSSGYVDHSIDRRRPGSSRTSRRRASTTPSRPSPASMCSGPTCSAWSPTSRRSSAARRRDRRAPLAAVGAHCGDQRQAHPARRYRTSTGCDAHGTQVDHGRRRTTNAAALVYGVAPAAPRSPRSATTSPASGCRPRRAPPARSSARLHIAGPYDDVVTPAHRQAHRRVGQHPRRGRHVHVGGVAVHPTPSATACRTAGARTCSSRSCGRCSA